MEGERFHPLARGGVEVTVFHPSHAVDQEVPRPSSGQGGKTVCVKVNDRLIPGVLDDILVIGSREQGQHIAVACIGAREIPPFLSRRDLTVIEPVGAVPATLAVGA
jgi:hypothetical protein